MTRAAISRPWFDEADAERLLESRRIEDRFTDNQFEALRHWWRHGYLTVHDVIPTADIDAMLADLKGLWHAAVPTPALRIEDLRLAPADPPGLSHEQLVALDPATRALLMREQPWRLHGFWQHSAATNRIFQSPVLAHWASLILGRQAAPTYTINFTFGSRQSLHQDTAVFFVSPMNYLVGAWLACEDIHPDSGPLVIYPGSHREPMFEAFSDYPKTNLKNCRPELIDSYHAHLDRVAKRYARVAYTPRKGETLLWHGMLIHGGDAIRNPSLTRKSYVCHYVPPECNKDAEATGPFNW